MKKILLFSLLTAMMIACFSVDADAQFRKKKKKKKKKTEQKSDYFDESGGFAHRLWYGAGGNLQFNGGAGQTIFTIGLTPMVGYKITENFSAGPKVGVNYTFFNDGFNKANLTSYSAGIFSRYKFLRSLFVHGELEYENEEILYQDFSTLREGTTNGFLGLGFNRGGGGLGYEVYVLYNFLEEEPQNSINIPFISITAPIVFRVGLTYKF